MAAIVIFQGYKIMRGAGNERGGSDVNWTESLHLQHFLVCLRQGASNLCDLFYFQQKLCHTTVICFRCC